MANVYDGLLDKNAKSHTSSFSRMFVALDFDDKSIKFLEKLSNKLRSSETPHVLHWTPTNQFHITLKFIGNMDENFIPRINYEMKIWSHATTCFREMSITSLTALPCAKKAKFIVLTLDDNENRFEKLAHHIDRFFTRHGFTAERRPFIPHVTIAKTNVPFDARHWLSVNSFAVGMFKLTCPTLTLFRSKLTKYGNVYIPIVQRYFTNDFIPLNRNAESILNK